MDSQGRRRHAKVDVGEAVEVRKKIEEKAALRRIKAVEDQVAFGDGAHGVGVLEIDRIALYERTEPDPFDRIAQHVDLEPLGFRVFHRRPMDTVEIQFVDLVGIDQHENTHAEMGQLRNEWTAGA